MEEACDISFKGEELIELQEDLLSMAFRNAHQALKIIAVVDAQSITISSYSSSNKVNRDAKKLKKQLENLLLNAFLL